MHTLRSIYGASFVLISVYAPLTVRKQLLSERIAHSRNAYDPRKYIDKAEALINRDLKDAQTESGQDVQATFPEADFFVDATDRDRYPTQVARFIDILFGHPFVTPTVDEYGMFHAKAAALRSADLSRQVGAVIASNEGEIISAGCNEVPKAGGGAFWDGQGNIAKDNRDFRIRHDSTAWMKTELIAEIFGRLRKEWLSPQLQGVPSNELARRALYEGDAPLLKGTRVDGLLEFGRIVHAEMSAVAEAARRGLSVRGAQLYCTTFPCHMCARLIIAAGIDQVIYIEPYPKSVAKELYRKSLRVDDDNEADADAVSFRPFVGVSPRRYVDLFEMKPRKDKRGYAIRWNESSSAPRIGRIMDYTNSENAIVELVGRLSEKLVA